MDTAESGKVSSSWNKFALYRLRRLINNLRKIKQLLWQDKKEEDIKLQGIKEDIKFEGASNKEVVLF